MASLKEAVTQLMAMLDGLSQEASQFSGTTERLTSWFEQEAKRLIMEGLDAIVNEILSHGPEDPFKLRLLVSANGRASAVDSNQPCPQGYQLLYVGEFLALIRSLKSQVSRGKWASALQFIKANRKVRGLAILPPTSIEKSKPDLTEQPGWKPSDFLPAPPPYPPLPRGLFKRRQH